MNSKIFIGCPKSGILFLIFSLFFSCRSYTFQNTEASDFSKSNAVGLGKVHNLRYLGGITNAEGRVLKDSVLYRSGHLHQLKDKDFDKLDALQIKKVIDLRTDYEVKKQKDHLPKNVSYQQLSAYTDDNDLMKKGKRKILKGEIDEKQAEQIMEDFYAHYLIEEPETIKAILHEILESDQPVLFHCSAGKDRTGMIAMLILEILKFDYPDIENEYLLSNNLRTDINTKRLTLAQNFNFLFPKMKPAALEKLLLVKSNFLKAAVNSVENKYGSMENYIRTVLDISEEKQNFYIEKFTR